ncbi:MAG: hypothetical protein ACNA8H_02750 [Anaerolineales bacterium]
MVRANFSGAVAAAGSCILFIVLVNLINLSSISAEIYLKMAESHAVLGQWAIVVPFNEAAIRLLPGEDFYYHFLPSVGAIWQVIPMRVLTAE